MTEEFMGQARIEVRRANGCNEVYCEPKGIIDLHEGDKMYPSGRGYETRFDGFKGCDKPYVMPGRFRYEFQEGERGKTEHTRYTKVIIERIF